MKTLLMSVRWMAVGLLLCSLQGVPGFRTGAVFQGQARSEKSGRTWDLTLTITAMAPSGVLRGEAAWPSLGSVNEIRGMSAGRTLTFEETGYIKQGGAHLQVEYALIQDGDTLKGRWIEPGSDWGTLELTARGQVRPTEPLALFVVKMKFTGKVTSARSADFPATIEIVEIDTATGNFNGTITWPTLNSVNRIDGKIDGRNITFKETQYIQRGGAHLNCEYQLVLQGTSLTGPWQEPGYDQGQTILTRE